MVLSKKDQNVEHYLRSVAHKGYEAKKGRIAEYHCEEAGYCGENEHRPGVNVEDRGIKREEEIRHEIKRVSRARDQKIESF